MKASSLIFSLYLLVEAVRTITTGFYSQPIIKLSSTNAEESINSSVSQTTSIRLTRLLTLGSWNCDFLNLADPYTPPSKMAINGTNICFKSCNTVSVPIWIDFDNLKVLTTRNIVHTHRNCSNKDKPLLNLIWSIRFVEANGNQTAIMMVFKDMDGKDLLILSRKLTGKEKRVLPYIAKEIKSQPQNVTISQETKVSDDKNISSVTIIDTPVAIPSQVLTLSSPAIRQTSVSSQNIEISADTQLPIGKYNPNKIFTMTLPPSIRQKILFRVTSNIIFLSGTCNSYVYQFKTSLVDSIPSNEIVFDVNSRQIQKHSDCDQSDDDLYTKVFENAVTFKLESIKTETILTFFDRNTKLLLSLTKLKSKS